MIALLLACHGPYELGSTPQPDPAELDLAWGDLHAHSAWSYDGCEEPDQLCTHSSTLPAEAFFAAAAEAGLDFAALTDHAEADLYTWQADALHEQGGAEAVWEGQQAAVLAAEGGPVLPVLGFEWTALQGPEEDAPGGHRTVLLEDPAACAAYRVAGRSLPDEGWVPDQGERRFDQDPDRVVETLPAALWASLDAAGSYQGCSPSRWVAFAHHPAYANPQEVDWGDPANTPHGEGLVELYSEHGSSECADAQGPGCAWMLNTAQAWSPDGSVHAALDRGYGLGFTAGTDGHDSRPGSLADGPSHVAHWAEGDGPEQHFGPGGLTGVLVQGPLDRPALFDGLLARRTVATSGPRPALQVWAEGDSGTRYNPGALVPREELPLALHLELGALAPAGTLAEDQVGAVVIEQLGRGGLLLDSEDGPSFTGEWSERGWTYLRVRWERAAGEGLDEERLWISPWFVEGACATAPAGGGLVLLLPLLALRRRSGPRRPQPRPGPAGPGRSTTTAPRLAASGRSASR